MMMNMRRICIPLAALAILMMAVFSATRLSGQDFFGESARPVGATTDEDVSRVDDEAADELSDDGEFDDEDGFEDDGFEDEDFEPDDFDEDGFGEDDFDEDNVNEDDPDAEEFGDDDFGDDDEEDRDEADRDEADRDEDDDNDFDRAGRRGFGREEMEIEDEFDEFGDEDEYGDDDVMTMEQMELAAWIGLELGPLDPAVAAHVALDAGQGLMVYEVLPGSPAEASGLQQFDILLSVAGAPLQNVAQLRERVQQSKDSQFSVEILRKGSRQQAQVIPGERPWNPDIYIPGSVQIPENVEVTISRRGSGPLTVTVREGEQTWTASSEEEFEQLPEKVVMWLFETMNEFMPLEDEEDDFESDWDEGEWSDEDVRRFDDEDFGRGEWREEEFGPDPLEHRINALEDKIDRVLGRLQEGRERPRQ